MVHHLGDGSDGPDEDLDKYEVSHLHLSLGEQELGGEERVLEDESALPRLVYLWVEEVLRSQQ